MSTPAGTVVVGKRDAIPDQLHRFALSAPLEIQTALSPVGSDPSSIAKLSQLNRRLGSLSLNRHVLDTIAQESVGLSPRLLVLNLSDHQFLFDPVSSQNDESRFSPEGTSFQRVIVGAFKRVPGHAGSQLKALLDDSKTLRLINDALVAWAGAHFIGVGWAGDALIVCVGITFLGYEIFEPAMCLARAVRLTMNAKNDSGLDEASEELGRAISLIGTDAFLALVTKTVAKQSTGPRKMGKADMTTQAKPSEKPPEVKQKAQPTTTKEQDTRAVQDDPVTQQLSQWTEGEASYYDAHDPRQTRTNTDGIGAYGRRVKQGSVAFGNRYFHDDLKKGKEILIAVKGFENVETPYGMGVFRIDDSMNKRFNRPGQYNIDFHPEDFRSANPDFIAQGRFPVKFKIVSIK